jgi:hypothetical protein
MRIGELTSGLKVHLTNEQLAFIRQLKNAGSLQRIDLDERLAYIAETMTSQGLIERCQDENQEVYYKLPVK